jgi:hypothetical protein
VFSKHMRPKDVGIEAAFRRVRKNAPIPLLEAPFVEDPTLRKANVKLLYLRDPNRPFSAQTNPVSEKQVNLMNVQTAEDYCAWRSQLDESIENTPLRTAQEKFHGAAQLLGSTSLDD